MKFKIEIRSNAAHVVWDNGAVRPASEIEVDLWNTIKALEKQHAELVSGIGKLLKGHEKPGQTAQEVKGSPSPKGAAATPPSAASAPPKSAPATTSTTKAPDPAPDTSALKDRLRERFGKRETPPGGPKLPG